MSNKNILSRILQILKQSTPYHISTIDCMNFLLGDKLEETDLRNNNVNIPQHSSKSYAQDALSETMLQEIANGNRTPSQTILNYLAASYDWSLSRLRFFYGLDRDLTPSESEKLVAGISTLCNEFIPNLHLSNFSDQVEYLVRLHFFNTTDTVIFPKYTQATSKNYASWTEKDRELRNKLKLSNIFFINGFPGMGKKQFVRHYLDYAISHKKYLPYNVAWINVASPDSSLKTTFTNSFAFLGNDITDLDKKCNLLKQKTSDAIIVIDCPLLKKEDFDFIDQYLTAIKIQFVIITRSAINAPRVSLHFTEYPVHILKEIFKKTLAKSRPFSQAEFSTLCSRVSYNPLAISLIAKMLDNAIKNNDKEKLSHLKKSLLDSKTWLWKESNLPKIHSLYKSASKSGIYITAILQRMLLDFPKQFMSTALSELALWTRYPIPLAYLKTISDSRAISTAIDYGLLQFNNKEKTTISMPSLLAETILDNYPLYFSDYEEKFRKIIYQSTIIQVSVENFVLVYTAIYNTLFYFQYDTIKLISRPSQEVLLRFDSWNNFLSDVISYYSNLGNSKYAFSLFDELYMELNYKNSERSKKLTPIRSMSSDSIKQALYCIFGDNKSILIENMNNLISKSEQLATVINTEEQLNSLNIGKSISDIFMTSFDRLIMQIYSDIKSKLDYAISLNKTYFSYINALTQAVNCSSQFLHSDIIYGYVEMIYHCLLALFYPESRTYYIKLGEEYYKSLQNNMLVSFDFKFKAALHRFFHILMQSYCPYVYQNILPSYDTYKNFSYTYIELYKKWNGRICSSQNMQMLFTVTSFYLKLLDFPVKYKTCEPGILLLIQDALDRFEYFLITQITPTEDEFQAAQKALNDSRELLRLLNLAHKGKTLK